METYFKSCKFLESRIGKFPKILLTLGSGIGSLVDEMQVRDSISFSDLGIAPSTVAGHASRLVIGLLGETPIACMQGRLHYYEGLPMRDVVFPFRLFAAAGAEVFVITNASGALHPNLEPPYILLVNDHINLMGTSPLIGPNERELGPRFPDMTRPYDPQLRAVFREVAKESGIPLHEGVYVATHGPSYETPSEVRMCRTLGGDAVGMSTVPEVIALRQMGKRVAALSCVTNFGAGVGPTEDVLTHVDVVANAEHLKIPLSTLLRESVRKIHGMGVHAGWPTA